jgi:hypothetical protein
LEIEHDKKPWNFERKVSGLHETNRKMISKMNTESVT